MKLTALEIKQQTFDKSLRGYDVAEVKAFLNIVSNEWEHLVTKNKDMERDLIQIREKLKHYEKVEEALHETLQTAKESAEHRLEGARKDAKNKIEKAEMEAESILRNARQEKQQIRQSVMRLLDRREEIISGMKSYLDRAQDALGTFSRDDSKLYNMPEDEQGQKKNEAAPKAKKAARKELTLRKASGAPGAEDIDDILDELD